MNDVVRYEWKKQMNKKLKEIHHKLHYNGGAAVKLSTEELDEALEIMDEISELLDELHDEYDL